MIRDKGDEEEGGFSGLKPAIEFVCPECKACLKVDDASAGMRVRCPSCARYILIPRPAAVRIVGLAKSDRERDRDADEERVLYTGRTAMFRAHPFWFVLAVALIAVGIGAIILLVWWLRALGARLTVTDRRTVLQKGILSKFTTEVWHADVRNLQVRQTFFQRIMGVGSVGISSAGQEDIEILAEGMPHPREIEAIIAKYRADRANGERRAGSVE